MTVPTIHIISWIPNSTPILKLGGGGGGGGGGGWATRFFPIYANFLGRLFRIGLLERLNLIRITYLNCSWNIH